MDSSHFRSLNPPAARARFYPLASPGRISCCCCRSGGRPDAGTTMAAPNPRSRPDSQGCVLPLPTDALYEILLRVPAKDHCRLRAFSRPWRSLFSDPHFITAHGTRHQEALIVAGYNTFHRNDGIICDVVDLTGRVVKRVRAPGDGVGAEAVRFIHLDFVCTSKGTYRCLRFLNLATGSAYALPEGLAEEHAAYQPYTNSWVEAAFGQVPTTGELKVVRVLDDSYEKQLFDVFTLDGGNHARWRGKKSPPTPVIFDCGRSVAVTVNGIAYFFAQFVQPQDFARDCIASFDLETEEWKPSLRGPLSSLADAPGSPDPDLGDLSMAAMNGCLVVVHNSNNIIDLWFLMDIERGLWVKKHSIQIQLDVWRPEADPYARVHPMVLNDGRIVLVHVGNKTGSLRIYNQKTNVSTHVAEVGYCFAVGLYTGSLLSLSTWDN